MDINDFRINPRARLAIDNTTATRVIIRFVRYYFGALALVAAALLLSGCATYEHSDGGGYTVRYDYASADSYALRDPHIVPRKRYTRRKRRHRHRHVESHPVVALKNGANNEIPSEYTKYVSDRGVRSLPSRMRMCRKARPGYCARPNYAHCHGSYCHAHPGGNKRHTH